MNQVTGQSSVFQRSLICLSILCWLPMPTAALEIQDIKATELQGRTEIRLLFDQVVPAGVATRKASSPLRQIVDFPVGLNNLGPILYDGSELGGPSIRVVHRLDHSSLEFRVNEDQPVYFSSGGRTMIMRLGGSPFVQLAPDPLAVPAPELIEPRMAALTGFASEPVQTPAQVAPPSQVAAQVTLPPENTAVVEQQAVQAEVARVGTEASAPPTDYTPEADPDLQARLKIQDQTVSLLSAPTEPATLMLSTEVQSVGKGEQLVMEFSDTPDVRQATLNGEVLEILVPNIEAAAQTTWSEGGLFSDFEARPHGAGLMVKLRLNEAAHQVYLAGKRVIVELQPLQSSREIADLQKPQGLPVVTSATLEEGEDDTVLKVSFDQPLSESVEAFDLLNPARFVVDLQADLDGLNEFVPLESTSRLSHLEFAREEKHSRLVLSLKDNYAASMSQSGRDLIIRVNGPKPFVATSQRTARPTMTNERANEMLRQEGLPIIQRPELLSIQTKLEDSGTEVIVLEFDSESVETKSRRIGDRLRVLIQDAMFEAELGEEVPLAPGRYFEQAHVKAGTRSVNLNLLMVNSNHQIRKNGKRIEVVLTPDASAYSDQAYLPGGQGTRFGRTKEVDDEANQPRYVGEPISLDFKDASIKSVMQLFAEFANMNLVLSEGVSGNVSVHLKDVPWDQALDIVMQTSGLTARHSGKVLIVSTLDEALARGAQAAESDVTDELEPLVSRTFLISYQTTTELVAILRDEVNNLMSRRGSVISDERTSQLLVEDTPQRVAKIAALVKQLDRPVEQVMIEAKIVLADTTVSKDLSVALQTARRSAVTGDDALQFGETGFFDGRSSSAVTGAYTLFNSAGTRFVNLQLQAFESNDRAKTVSNPRVITSNKQEAVIEQGTEVPYRVASSSGATEIEFRSATLKLQVTPQVAPDGSIMLDVEVSKDTVGQETSGGVSINTRSVSTKVAVMNGGTVVLGGIFEKSDQDSKSQVPGLGDLPVVGGLFRSTGTGSTETELLIFLTPVILSGT